MCGIRRWLAGRDGIDGTIAGCRPKQAGFAAQFERLAANQRVPDLRRFLHTQPDELGRPPLFEENLPRLAGTGLSFDFCVLQRQIPIAPALARACP
jgi:predicted TIM-barrel fold metal-dependent hydrolase